MNTPSLKLPRLRKDQFSIAANRAAIRMVSCGRRWGKTTTGGCIALACAAQGYPVGWAAMTYKNSRPLWQFARRAVRELKAAGLCRVSESDRTIEFLDTGGILSLYSLDQPESILGSGSRLFVLDEAARADESVVTEIILPSLADFEDSELLCISTPNSLNWFWEWFMRGMNGEPGFASFTAPSTANPMPSIRKAYERAKLITPAARFAQEWDAVFVDSGGSVFENVDACATAKRQKAADGEGQFVIGCDLGKSVDSSCAVVYDMTTKSAVHMLRLTDMTYKRQITRFVDLDQRFCPSVWLVEKNSVGDAVIEMMRDADLEVVPFVTSNATKQNMVDRAQIAFQNRDIKIINDPILKAELKAFGGKKLPSGMWKYEARYGHDDCVMALLLALEAAATSARRVTKITANPFYQG